jgi:hypothetical protein
MAQRPASFARKGEAGKPPGVSWGFFVFWETLSAESWGILEKIAVVTASSRSMGCSRSFFVRGCALPRAKRHNFFSRASFVPRNRR